MSILRDLSLYMSTYNFSFNQVVIINMIWPETFSGKRWSEAWRMPLCTIKCKLLLVWEILPSSTWSPVSLYFSLLDFPSFTAVVTFESRSCVGSIWNQKKKKRMPHLPCKCSNTSTAIIEISLLCRIYVLWPIFDGEQDSKPVTCLSFSSHRLFLSYSAYWFVLVLHYLVFAQLSNC